MIKLGDQPRCLIGHWTVKRAQYEKDLYDPAKAAEGKREKAIDVEFDRVINYEKDKHVDQAELNAKCSAQYWSPQSSGIEIKQEVLPTLVCFSLALLNKAAELVSTITQKKLDSRAIAVIVYDDTLNFNEDKTSVKTLNINREFLK